jgi:hypothetical protein
MEIPARSSAAGEIVRAQLLHPTGVTGAEPPPRSAGIIDGTRTTLHRWIAG